MAKKKPKVPKNHPIHVTFNPTTKKVSIAPPGEIRVDYGNDSIIFSRPRQNPNFTFADITFKPGGPFVKSVQDGQIVVIDQNTNTSKSDDLYKYTLSVKDAVGTYSLDPRIRNISF